MAELFENANEDLPIYIGGNRYDLVIVTRDDFYQPVSVETLADLTMRTVGLWVASFNHYLEKNQETNRNVPELEFGIDSEHRNYPLVTVFNRNGKKLSVNSLGNGTSAVKARLAQDIALEKMNALMPSLFTNNASQVSAKQQKQPDLDDIDAALGNSQETTIKGNYFVREAMLGSREGDIKIEKGAKDKKTWQMAILDKDPYDYKTIKYQDKDLVAYPVLGKVELLTLSGKRAISVPVNGSNIVFFSAPDTRLKDGKTVPSDWTRLVKHLGIDPDQLPDHSLMEVPATHIVLKIGKTNDDGFQYKNYDGFYALK